MNPDDPQTMNGRKTRASIGRSVRSERALLHCIVTVDYELPAGGRGDVRYHMIEPTARLLDVCEAHDARLTVMAEVGEIQAFEGQSREAYAAASGYEPSEEIRGQLVSAVRRGHDVQLHLHPQWRGARWRDDHWDLDYRRYQLTDSTFDEAVDLLRSGKRYLDDLLKPQVSDYSCIGFRAGNWNTQPAEFYLAALRQAGLRSDTSVFKWGYARSDAANFDYRAAHSHFRAWYASDTDINRLGETSGIIEVPIATLLVPVSRMLTLTRLRRAFTYLSEDKSVRSAIRGVSADVPRAQGAESPQRRLSRRFSRRLFRRRAKKLDFCKLSAREMGSMLRVFVEQAAANDDDHPTPLVLIGHSKQRGAERSLERFLRLAKQRFGDALIFSNYRDFVEKYRESPSVGTTPCRREASL